MFNCIDLQELVRELSQYDNRSEWRGFCSTFNKIGRFLEGQSLNPNDLLILIDLLPGKAQELSDAQQESLAFIIHTQVLNLFKDAFLHLAPSYFNKIEEKIRSFNDCPYIKMQLYTVFVQLTKRNGHKEKLLHIYQEAQKDFDRITTRNAPALSRFFEIVISAFGATGLLINSQIAFDQARLRLKPHERIYAAAIKAAGQCGALRQAENYFNLAKNEGVSSPFMLSNICQAAIENDFINKATHYMKFEAQSSPSNVTNVALLYLRDQLRKPHQGTTYGSGYSDSAHFQISELKSQLPSLQSCE